MYERKGYKKMIELNYDKQLVSTKVIYHEDRVTEYEVTRLTDSTKIKVTLSLPAVNVTNNWHPTKGFDSSLKADWSHVHLSSISQSAPVESFYGVAGNNVLTVAWDELVNKVEMRPGIHEEDGTLTLSMAIESNNSATYRLLIIEKPCQYTEALARVTQWWEKQLSLFPVTNAQRLPMYSTWYAFHQNVTDQGLREELPYIKQLGIDTIIIDDGWQTDDTNRGYAFCGDWQVANSKFPDFEGFVSEMHQQKMKIMVWFSVPFVGINSRKWRQVEDKLLMYNEELEAGVLDIRYQENIDFLVKTYTDFIDRYHIDGLKLDFIDEFRERTDTPKYKNGMQYRTVEDALICLMEQIKRAVLTRQPDFFIEFRQRYIGPAMRQYSNAFRVNDCPYSAISNRLGIADLRMISGQTPVHSDMLMWHQDDTSENIGIQLAASIFGVIQLSVKLKEQREAQLATIRFYIKFAREHVKLLQLSPLSAREPENLYSVMKVASDTQEIIAIYSQQQIVKISKKESWLINGNGQSTIYLMVNNAETGEIAIYDAQGQLKKSILVKNGLTEIPQFPGGITEISLG